MMMLQSDLRSAIQIAATFCYINPRPNRYETPPYRRVSVRTPVRTAAAALKIEVSDKPPICTADELHYVSIHNSDWRLTFWRYKPPPQAPSRNHPLLLLSGVGTNAIGYDLAPGVSLKFIFQLVIHHITLVNESTLPSVLLLGTYQYFQ